MDFQNNYYIFVRLHLLQVIPYFVKPLNTLKLRREIKVITKNKKNLLLWPRAALCVYKDIHPLDVLTGPISIIHSPTGYVDGSNIHPTDIFTSQHPPNKSPLNHQIC